MPEAGCRLKPALDRQIETALAVHWASRWALGESRMTEPHHLPAERSCCVHRCTTDRRHERKCNNKIKDGKKTLRNEGHAAIRAPGAGRVWPPWGPQTMMSSCTGSNPRRAAPWNRETGSVRRDRGCFDWGSRKGYEWCGGYNFQVLGAAAGMRTVCVCAGGLSAGWRLA